MPVDQNGLVTIENSIGDYAANTALLTGASQPEVSISALVAAALAAAEGAQRIVIDVDRRKLVAADYDWTPITDAELFTSGHKKQTIAPVADSEGRSVQWEETARDSGMHATLPDLVETAVDPARPYRTVQSMVSTILSKVPDGRKVCIVVDQNAKNVKVVDYTAEGVEFTDAFDAAYADVVAADNAVALALSEPSVDGGPAALPFEGGAF